MAYVLQNDDEDELNLQASQGGMVSGGQSNVVQGPSQGSRSGNFTSISKYLDANQGRIPGFAQGVADSVQAKGQEALNTQNQGLQDFTSKISQGTPVMNTELLSQAVSSPQDIIGDPSKVKAFQEQTNAAYSGPLSYQGSDEQIASQRAASEAIDYGKSFEDEASRIEALKAFQAPSRVTQGKAVLDASLLGVSGPQGISALQQYVTPQVSALEQYLGQGQTTVADTAQQRIAQAQQDVDGIRDAYQNAFFGPQGAISTIGQELEARSESALQAALQRDKAVIDQLAALSRAYSTLGEGGYSVTEELPQWAADAGMTQQSYESLVKSLTDYAGSGSNESYRLYEDVDRYGNKTGNYFLSKTEKHAPFIGWVSAPVTTPSLDINQFLTYTPEELLGALFTPEAVATEDERARLAALEQLLGTDIDYYSGTLSPAPQETSEFDINAALNLIDTRTRENLEIAQAFEDVLNRPITEGQLRDLYSRLQRI